MERHKDLFTPDEVDGQLEQLLRSSQSHPSQEPASTNIKLIRHLHSFYQEESAEVDQRSLERVGALLQQSEGLIFDRDDVIAQTAPGNRESQPSNPSPQSRKNRAWQRRISLIAAAVLLTLLVGSMTLVLNLAHSSKNSAGDHTDDFVYTLRNENLDKLDLQGKKAAWSKPVTTDGYAGRFAAVGNGIVYIGASLSDVRGKVYTEIPYVSAYNAQTGTLLWRVRLDGGTLGNVQLGFIMQPVVANGLVYVISNAGKVYALDALTGSRRWVYDTHKMAGVCGVEPVLKTYDCVPTSQPDITVGTDGVVYTSVKNYLFALNGSSGSKIWAASISPSQSISTLVPGPGSLYVTSSELRFDDPILSYNNLYAFNAETGQQRWLVSKLSGGFDDATIANSIVYIASYEGTIYAFHVRDGSLLWQKSPGGQLSVGLDVVNGVIYVQTDVLTRQMPQPPLNPKLFALNASDGTIRWQRRIDTHNTIPNFQIVTGGVIYLATVISPPPERLEKVIHLLPGHFVIDAYSTQDGHKL